MSRAAGRAAGSRVVETVPVALGDRSYDILIGSALLPELGVHLGGIVRPGVAAVVTNPTVRGLYGEVVATALAGVGFDPVTIEVPDGEAHKNLASLARIYDGLVAARVERGSLIVALGGGVIGDLAGFAAATFLRGVPFVQVPTTVLAQVDSSVGGKTGVNHPSGKNLIGAFYQPRKVIIDLDTLNTLPARELRAGLAEVVKYGAILSASLFAAIERDLDRLLACDHDALRPVIRECCALKAMVVERDERETDYRAILNFGHTLAHAIESLTGYERYLHGEAVAIGMTFAARLSHRRGLCAAETVERLVRALQAFGLPTEIPPGLDRERIAQVVASDKKVAARNVKFVCLENIGAIRFEAIAADEVAALAVGGDLLGC
jgi:3-dehydroquinate synthase